MNPICRGCSHALVCTKGVWYCNNFKCRRRGLTVRLESNG